MYPDIILVSSAGEQRLLTLIWTQHLYLIAERREREEESLHYTFRVENSGGGLFASLVDLMYESLIITDTE